MKITGIIWLDDVIDKLSWKHAVDIYEVEDLLDNSPRIRFVENGNRKGENVYVAFGQTNGGRYLVCFFIHKSDRQALVLSARDMTAAERRRYERK